MNEPFSCDASLSTPPIRDLPHPLVLTEPPSFSDLEGISVMSTTAVILLSNLHCDRYALPSDPDLLLTFPSCVNVIEHALAALQPPPAILEISIIHQAVII